MLPHSPELTQIVKKARRISELLKALAHEDRLLLLFLLSERERSVSELGEFLSLRQTTVSAQLARLRLNGLVTTRRDGKTVYYSAAATSTLKLVTAIHEVFYTACEDRNSSS